MWICLNDAFLSIVDKAEHRSCLLVRARREGDIERVFPGCSVKVTPSADYRFRAEIVREHVSEAIAKRVEDVDYMNFKDSVVSDQLQNAYLGFWSIMNQLQGLEIVAKAPAKKKGRRQ